MLLLLLLKTEITETLNKIEIKIELKLNPGQSDETGSRQRDMRATSFVSQINIFFYFYQHLHVNDVYFQFHIESNSCSLFFNYYL